MLQVKGSTRENNLIAEAVYDFVIPGFETQAGKFSPRKSLRRLPETLRAELLEPQLLRAPNGDVLRIKPSIRGAAGKAQVIENWLKQEQQLHETHPVRASGEGHLMEFIAQDILHVMARDYGFSGPSGENYGVIPAPYQLDRTDRSNRGGDLLLVKYDNTGVPSAISLIDVKMTRPPHKNESGKTVRRSRQLKSGMNRRLNYPIPTIVVFLGDTSFSSKDGRKLTLHEYLGDLAYYLAKDDKFEGFLPGLDAAGEEELFGQVREQIHKGCIATKAKIQEAAKDRGELDSMLFQLAMTDKVLGARDPQRQGMTRRS